MNLLSMLLDVLDAVLESWSDAVPESREPDFVGELVSTEGHNGSFGQWTDD